MDRPNDALVQTVRNPQDYPIVVVGGSSGKSGYVRDWAEPVTKLIRAWASQFPSCTRSGLVGVAWTTQRATAGTNSRNWRRVSGALSQLCGS